jgi:hypothetical protein
MLKGYLALKNYLGTLDNSTDKLHKLNPLLRRDGVF